MFAPLFTPPTLPQPKLLSPRAAANFKRVLVGWEEKAHANPGCHRGFIPLARAQASLIERLLLQLGLSSLNWLPDPPVGCSLSYSSEAAVMSSQNAVC